MEVADLFKPGTTKHCVFGGCKSDNRRDSTPFLSFPKPCFGVRRQMVDGDENHIKRCCICAKTKLWISKCQRQNFSELSQVKKWHYICVLHFVNETGPSEENPFPLPVSEASLRRMNHQSKEMNNTRAMKENINILNCGESSIDKTGLACDTFPQPPERFSSSVAVATLEDFNKLADENSKLKEENGKLKEENGKLKKQNGRLEKENRALMEECEKLKEAERKLNEQYVNVSKKLQRETVKNNVKSVSYENVKTFVHTLKISDKKCKFYTGLTFRNISALFSFLSPVDEMRYWGVEPTQTCNVNKKKLNHFEELILVLVRLRTGLLVEDMKYRFNLSTGYISKIVITWVQHCYLKFNVMRPLMFPTRDKIKERLPAVFKELKNIRVIIDCAEFFCESPSDFEHQGNLYSSYKATTTFKVLLGCTPNGVISFVSELFEGSISDKELVRQSKLLDLLEEGDLVLADRGFTISDLTNARNVSLNIPPFLKGRDTLTAEEEIATKKIAKLRIYIEHVVAKMKQFRLLKKRLNLNMRGILSQMVFVCACLVNFQEPIVKR